MGFKKLGGVDKNAIGLGEVDNTSDADKPISTATQTALDLKAPKASPTFTGTVSGVTKSMVGLSNVDNTSDVNKPVSTAMQTALNLKAPMASPTFTGTVSGITKAMISGPKVVDNIVVVPGATYTIGPNDNVIFVDSTLSDIDIYLPDPALKRHLRIYNKGLSFGLYGIKFHQFASENWFGINVATVLDNQYSNLDIFADGTDYYFGFIFSPIQ